MTSAAIWKTIYLRTLEIEGKHFGEKEHLENFMEQLATITEIIPDHTDPASEFELYVVGKLCRTGSKIIDTFLQKNGNPTNGVQEE
jgi:hypothetical protein